MNIKNKETASVRQGATPALKFLDSQERRAAKRMTVKESGGRSMVEMLGVLAIIGVLSVGALAGFNKAMMNHKLNKQIEQFNSLLTSVINHADNFRDISGNINQYIISLKELSPDMVVDGRIYDTFQT